ncbi:hypothetical protein K8T06_01115 [bacterium]|nr:hypothetical protein [bacterium]
MIKVLTNIHILIMGMSLLSCGAQIDENQKKTTQQQSTVIAYVINLDGQKVAVFDEDISRSVKAAVQNVSEKISSKKLTKDQIKELAREIGLLTETKTNPHLSFLDGDIAYWTEQGLSFTRLRLEFTARKAVLVAADRAKVIIDDQGKLSWASQQIISKVLKEFKAMEIKQ